MNYGEIQVQVQEWAHRTDLAGAVGPAINDVTKELNARFGLELGPLVADTDTNIILEYNSDLYKWGGLAQMAGYTHNLPAFREYTGKYEQRIKDMNINYRGTEWDTDSPFMAPAPEAA